MRGGRTRGTRIRSGRDGSGSPDQKNVAQKILAFIFTTVIAAVIGTLVAYLAVPAFKDREDAAQDPVKLGEPPFHVEVREAFTEADDGKFWVFPNRLPAGSFDLLTEPLPSDSSKDTIDRLDERRAEEARALSALDGMRAGRNCEDPCISISRYHVTLTGNRKQPVHIESIRARVLSKVDAPSGTLLAIPPEGGGPADTIYIDLDAQRSDAVEVDERNNPTDRIFADVQNRFAAEGEPLDFVIIAGTEEPLLYEWELMLEVTQDGKRETQTVRLENDQPFRAVGWLAVLAAEGYDVVYELDYARKEIVEKDR